MRRPPPKARNSKMAAEKTRGDNPAVQRNRAPINILRPRKPRIPRGRIARKRAAAGRKRLRNRDGHTPRGGSRAAFLQAATPAFLRPARARPDAGADETRKVDGRILRLRHAADFRDHDSRRRPRRQGREGGRGNIPRPPRIARGNRRPPAPRPAAAQTARIYGRIPRRHIEIRADKARADDERGNRRARTKRGCSSRTRGKSGAGRSTTIYRRRKPSHPSLRSSTPSSKRPSGKSHPTSPRAPSKRACSTA